MTAETGIRLIRGAAQHYDWGSIEAIPSILGVDPDGRPWAELWLGDHPTAPATIPAESGRPLDVHLPFLLKLLAAASPLSLQVHPSRAQAEAGYEREESAGIPADAPERTYRDRNHKPELLCALSPFRALCGFRDPAASAADLRRLGVEALNPVVAALEDGRLDEALRLLLSAELGDTAAIARDAAHARRDDPWTATIAEAHPDDIGVVTSLLLNRVELRPSDGLYLDAGTLHAYLGGTAIELMACSDNVVRGGLTSKFVDTRELLAVLDPRPAPPVIVEPEQVDAATTTWRTPAQEFRLWCLEPTPEPLSVDVFGPEVLFCLNGHAVIDGIPLVRGTAAFVASTLDAYSISGDATIYRATVGVA